jgi:hypothetical protein
MDKTASLIKLVVLAWLDALMQADTNSNDLDFRDFAPRDFSFLTDFLFYVEFTIYFEAYFD